MARTEWLFIYPERGVLKVCIPPEEAFFSTPFVVARRTELVLAFGNEALDKDERWRLTWLQGGKAQVELFRAFFQFVFEQPAVRKKVRRCKKILVVSQNILVPASNGRKEFFSTNHPVSSLLPKLSLKVYSSSLEGLSLSGRSELGKRYCLNIK